MKKESAYSIVALTCYGILSFSRMLKMQLVELFGSLSIIFNIHMLLILISFISLFFGMFKEKRITFLSSILFILTIVLFVLWLM